MQVQVSRAAFVVWSATLSIPNTLSHAEIGPPECGMKISAHPFLARPLNKQGLLPSVGQQPGEACDKASCTMQQCYGLMCCTRGMQGLIHPACPCCVLCRPGVYFTARADGLVDTWDILLKGHRTPSLSYQVTGVPCCTRLSTGASYYLYQVSMKATRQCKAMADSRHSLNSV